MVQHQSCLRNISILISLFTIVNTTNLPYNPTRIHLSSQSDGDNHAYIIQPGLDSTISAQLSAIDLSVVIDSTKPSIDPLSSSLPFFSSGKSTAYTSFMDNSGNITILAGDCKTGVDGTSIWKLSPNAKAKNGGIWIQEKVINNNDNSNNNNNNFNGGANYLNAAFSFSEIVGGNITDIDFYAFGGMCSNINSDESKWITNGNYSNTMITYTPQISQNDYQITSLNTKGPPIAEAGMSMTPLLPTFSNISGKQTQQQNFVILGGHTQSAFINMSQVALFSLPQATWSFLPVQQPNNVVSLLDPNFVTPRSGHTAILTEDGQSIIVYGGWVGDINTPATPLMVSLQLGSGYGGSGNWKWNTINLPLNSSIKDDSLYGHGAVILPGNVMMIIGGYSIPSSSSSSSTSKMMMKKDDNNNNNQNTQTLLYNITSNTWLTSYNSPLSNDNNNNNNNKSNSTGLGVGITFGLLGLIGIFALSYWYQRRNNHRSKSNRDSVLLNGFPEKSNYYNNNKDDGWEKSSLKNGKIESDILQEKEAFPWLPETTHQIGLKSDFTSGAFLNIPSPTRGLRRPSSGRLYNYQPTLSNDENHFEQPLPPPPPPPVIGIHPIVEMDEEGSTHSRKDSIDLHKRLLAAQELLDDGGKTRMSTIHDPFSDVHATIYSSSSSSKIVDNMEKENPFQNHNHIDHLSSSRCSSPSKSDDRTLSNLSDGSSYTFLSGKSLTRTTSTRSFFSQNKSSHLLIEDNNNNNNNPYDINHQNPYDIPSRTTSFNNRKVKSSTSHDQLRSPIDTSSSSYRQTSPINQFIRRPSSLYSRDFTTSPLQSNPYNPFSPNVGPSRKKMNWVGSMRKALVGTTRNVSSHFSPMSTSIPEPLLHSQPAIIQSGDIAAYHARSQSSSPIKNHRGNNPRRTASESSTFLATKRGREDWEDDDHGIINNDQEMNKKKGRNVNAWNPYYEEEIDEPDGGDWGNDHPILQSLPSPDPVQPLNVIKHNIKGEMIHNSEKQIKRKPIGGHDKNGDEDWDVEKAVEKRDVQVMFTLPKARLRVVNGDPDGSSLRSVSGGK